MPTVKGREAARSLILNTPEHIAAKILPGAARAGGNVIAEEARSRSISDEVTAAIKVQVKREAGRVVARVQVKGKGAYLAPWLEYGTQGHFISVADDQREGRTAGRINRLDRAAKADGRSGPGESLKIGGNFVGGTVWHPGARAHPFMRVSLDVKEAEAVKAAQGYINTRVARMRATGMVEPEGSGE